LIGRRVVAAGVPGEVTAQALERLPAVLDEQVMISCGAWATSRRNATCAR